MFNQQSQELSLEHFVCKASGCRKERESLISRLNNPIYLTTFITTPLLSSNLMCSSSTLQRHHADHDVLQQDNIRSLHRQMLVDTDSHGKTIIHSIPLELLRMSFGKNSSLL